jgi:prolyl 4-hydroxylase
MIMYLNDGCEGGVTRFPRVGLDVYPNKGSVLVFGSHRDGKENPLALHMSPEIKSGEKWIAVKWFLR